MSLIVLSGTSTSQDTNYVYNPFYFALSGTNTNHLNYKFIVDVVANGNNAGRYKFYATPSNNVGYFTPHRILQNYATNDNFDPTVTAPTLNLWGIILYTLRWGEEFDSNPFSAATGTTIYSNITSTNGICLNAIYQHDETPVLNDYDWSKLTLSKHTKFLTNWDANNRKTIFLNEYETHYLYTSNPVFGPAQYLIATYDFSGGSIGFYSLPVSGVTGGFQLDYRHELPSGTKNLAISAFNQVSSLTDTIINGSVYSYSILFQNQATRLTERIYFDINQKCLQFDKTRIAWLNRFGGYDYFTFYLMKRDFISVKKNNWSKRVDQNYSVGKRGSSVLNTYGQSSFNLTSDWITSEEATFISVMFTSPEIYLIKTDGTKIPLVLKTSDFEIKNLDNDRLINYTIEFDYSHLTYGQSNG